MRDENNLDILDFLEKPKKEFFLTQPQNFLLITAIMISLIPFFVWGESAVIYINERSVFISGDAFIYLASGLLIIGWVIYKFTARLLLTKYLSWIHVCITVGILFLFLATGAWFLKSKAASDLEAIFLKQLMINRQRDVKITSALGIIFIIGQLAYLINLAGGLLRRKYNDT